MAEMKLEKMADFRSEFGDDFEYENLTLEELKELRWNLGLCWMNPNNCVCADKSECKGLSYLIKGALNAVEELIRAKETMVKICDRRAEEYKREQENASIHGLSEREVGRMLEECWKGVIK